VIADGSRPCSGGKDIPEGKGVYQGRAGGEKNYGKGRGVLHLILREEEYSLWRRGSERPWPDTLTEERGKVDGPGRR